MTTTLTAAEVLIDGRVRIATSDDRFPAGLWLRAERGRGAEAGLVILTDRIGTRVALEPWQTVLALR